jgi:RNA polymerase sigma factor (sigma-70 family)
MEEKDEILVQRVLTGDAEAFGELVNKYKSAVFALAFHKIGNFEDAKDISQEAFIKAYTKLPKLRKKSSFANWLKKITWSVASHWLRDTSRRREVFIEDIPGVRDVSDHRNILPARRSKCFPTMGRRSLAMLMSEEWDVSHSAMSMAMARKKL